METFKMEKSNNIFCHIGCMRTASTYLQEMFANHGDINLLLKTRFFSYDPFFNEGVGFLKKHIGSDSGIIIDSDENYSLGRFKNELIKYSDEDFNFKKEIFVISHDIEKMAERIYSVYPNGKIFFIIRKQKDWIQSVYKHDIQHFGIDSGFDDFIKSDLGQSYLLAGNYNNMYFQYCKLFGESNVKVFFFEDLKKDEDLFLSSLSTYLGVSLSTVDGLKKNEAKSDSFLKVNRLINKLSQKNPQKVENRLYYLLRSFLTRNNRLINGLMKRHNLISNDALDSFQSHFNDSNRALAESMNEEKKMKDFGYF